MQVRIIIIVVTAIKIPAMVNAERSLLAISASIASLIFSFIAYTVSIVSTKPSFI